VLATTPYDEVLRNAQALCDARVSTREQARVLDAGSGLRAYVEFPPHVHVTGVDVSQDLLDANGRLDERILADLHAVELAERSYDCVVCWDVLEHLEDPSPVVEKLARSVADNGILIVGSPEPRSVKGLVTKFTPYSFHLWFYRRYVDAHATDEPGAGPYRTFMRKGGGARSVQRAAEQMGLQVVYSAWLEAPMQIVLRERFRLTGRFWRTVSTLTRIVSLGLVCAEATDYLFVFERPSERST
jgi:SAM-dependent methyltransferase